MKKFIQLTNENDQVVIVATESIMLVEDIAASATSKIFFKECCDKQEMLVKQTAAKILELISE